MIPLHRFETRDNILKGAGLDVADVGNPIRGWRSIVKHKAPLGGILGEGFLEDLLVVPVLQDLLFEFGELRDGHSGAIYQIAEEVYGIPQKQARKNRLSILKRFASLSNQEQRRADAYRS